MSNLPALLARLKEASGPFDGATAAGIANSLSPWMTESPEWSLFVKALRGSIDAALALVEQKRGEQPIEWTRSLLERAIIHAWKRWRDGDGDWLALLPIAIVERLVSALIAEKRDG